MIHVEATIKYAGYDPRELDKWSKKRVCRVCDVCGRVKWVAFRSCSGTCHLCANRTDEHRRKISEANKGVSKTAEHRKKIGDGNRGKIVSSETRANMSESLRGKKKPPRTDEHCSNLSKATKGKKLPPLTDEARRNRSKAQKGKKMPPHTDEHRRNISAGLQGIPYEEWTGFVSNGAYCEKFDEACRERIREKYNRKCYICDKNETDNGRKLDVHHVDMNKNQGCDGVLWNLVPLCRSCHASIKGYMIGSRLVFLLDHNV